MNDFQAKHIMVTGASGGIGQFISRELADPSVNLTLHYHQNGEAASGLQQSIQSPTHCVGADLRQEEEVEALFAEAIETWGPVDVLIANAGFWPSVDESVDQISVERWRNTIDSNLTATFLCMKHFLQNAREHNLDSPIAVMIGSTAGVFGEAGHGDYAAAKAALIHGLLPTLKNEFCRVVPGGRVNVVNPGWTMTPMTKKFSDNPQAQTRSLQTIALRKFATPGDIAQAVAFLCSDKSGHITGQALTVSGGMEGRVLYDSDELES